MCEIPAPQSRTIAAIYERAAAARNQYDSWGIPFSQLGNECDRALWYAFRHAYHQQARDGRIARLLETGNLQEARIIEELRGIGCTVERQQEKVTLCRGHLRGKIEGIVSGIPDAPKTPHLLEIKTHKADSWRAVAKHGLAAKKYEHHVQVMLGMHATGTSRGFYIAHNKDTDELLDDLNIVRIKYDPVEALALEARANRIIDAPRPPLKAHDDPSAKAAFKCKLCPALGMCHGGEWPARTNCRTCLHSAAVDDGAWYCAALRVTLTRKAVAAGCERHLFIPDLIPAEQIDADAVANTVTYRLPDGNLWTDGRDEIPGEEK